MQAPLRLSTRLALTHGVLAALAFVLFAVTLQGVYRIGRIMTDLHERELSTIDAEEDVYRAAWQIEIVMRRGRALCLGGSSDEPRARHGIFDERDKLRDAIAQLPRTTPAYLRNAAQRYANLAEASLAQDTCQFLLSPETDQLRIRLDEEVTDAWIARLRQVP